MRSVLLLFAVLLTSCAGPDESHVSQLASDEDEGRSSTGLIDFRFPHTSSCAKYDKKKNVATGCQENQRTVRLHSSRTEPSDQSPIISKLTLNWTVRVRADCNESDPFKIYLRMGKHRWSFQSNVAGWQEITFRTTNDRYVDEFNGLLWTPAISEIKTPCKIDLEKYAVTELAPLDPYVDSLGRHLQRYNALDRQLRASNNLTSVEEALSAGIALMEETLDAKVERWLELGEEVENDPRAEMQQRFVCKEVADLWITVGHFGEDGQPYVLDYVPDDLSDVLVNECLTSPRSELEEGRMVIARRNLRSECEQPGFGCDALMSEAIAIVGEGRDESLRELEAIERWLDDERVRIRNVRRGNERDIEALQTKVQSFSL